MRDNLLTVYSQATTDDMNVGLAFYPLAFTQCHDWARYSGHNPLTVAGVVAALSPQVDWPHNLETAEHMVFGDVGYVYRGIRKNFDKAECILRDGAIDISPYFKRGLKVVPFSRNLAGDSEAVTVDTHAIQAAHNDVYWPQQALTPRTYAQIANAYVDSARAANLRPCDFQSVVWHVWKRLWPRAVKIQLRSNRW